MDQTTSTIYIIFGVIICLFAIMVPFANRLSRKRTYSIDPENNKFLVIRANTSWRKCEVYLDGTLVGKVNNKRKLLAGSEFQLANQTVVRIQLIKLFLSYSELQVWYNGKPLQDFTPFTGSRLNFNKGVAAIAIVGIFPFIWLITLISLRLIINHRLAFTPYEIPIIISFTAWGILFLALSFFAQHKSLLAMLIGTLIYILDGVLGVFLYLPVVNGLLSGGKPGILEIFQFSVYIPWGIAFLIMHIFLLVLMFQGIAAMIALKKNAEKSRSKPIPLLLAFIITILVGVGIYEAATHPNILAKVKSFYTNITFPISDLSLRQPGGAVTPEPVPQEKVESNKSVCWTAEVTGFSGNRSQAWESKVDPQIQTLITFSQFIDEVVTQNPQLVTDGYVFKNQNTYSFPEVCH